MKLIGERKLDHLGRIVMPSELRRNIGWDSGIALEIYRNGDSVVLKRGQVSCVFCQSDKELIEYRGKHICKECRAEMQAKDRQRTDRKKNE